MRSILQGMVVLGCLGSVTTAFADGAATYVFAMPKAREAKDHLKRGARLYNNQAFEDAIEEFKAGALIEPCSAFDYNLGQAYRQLGRYKEALWHYQRFLSNGKPTGDVLASVQQWLSEMQAQLANTARTMPPIEPVSEGTQAAAATTWPATTSPTHAAAQPHDRAVEVISPGDRGGTTSWLGWSTTVGGVAALGTTGYLFASSSNLDDDANNDLNARARNQLHDRASTRRIAGAIVGVGGVVLTAAGVYMLVASRHHDRSTTASLDIGLTGRGVVVFGQF